MVADSGSAIGGVAAFLTNILWLLAHFRQLTREFILGNPHIMGIVNIHGADNLSSEGRDIWEKCDHARDVLLSLSISWFRFLARELFGWHLCLPTNCFACLTLAVPDILQDIKGDTHTGTREGHRNLLESLMGQLVGFNLKLRGHI